MYYTFHINIPFDSNDFSNYAETIFPSLNIIMTVRRIVHEQSNNPNFNLEEYCKRNNIDISNIYSDQQRIELVTNNILEHYEKHTKIGTDTYTSLFAIQSVPLLQKYYTAFKKLNKKGLKIAAIFTYAANEDMDEGADTPQSREFLEQCIKDYRASHQR